jgi:hypothetical protein
MKMKTSSVYKLIIFFMVPLMVIALQNCTVAVDTHSEMSSGSVGTGDSYSGKISVYAQYDQGSAACTTTTASGAALPNYEVLVVSSSAKVVRENCADISPRQLVWADLRFSGPDNSNLQIEGRTLARVDNIETLQNIPLVCPAGKTNLSSPVASNIFQSSFDWTSSPWNIASDLSILPVSTVAALPLYEIKRLTYTSTEMWHRAGQFHGLDVGIDYAFHVVLKSGTLSKAVVHYNKSNNAQFGMVIDLQNQSTSFNHNIGVSNVTAVLQPYQGATLATIYFTVPAGPESSDIGVTSYSGTPTSPDNVGDSVLATAADLRKVSDYCSP